MEARYKAKITAILPECNFSGSRCWHLRNWMGLGLREIAIDKFSQLERMIIQYMNRRRFLRSRSTLLKKHRQFIQVCNVHVFCGRPMARAEPGPGLERHTTDGHSWHLEGFICRVDQELGPDIWFREKRLDARRHPMIYRSTAPRDPR